jgi:hypothetical protein
MKIVDATDQVLDVDFDNSKERKNSPLSLIKSGLYVLVFKNSNDLNILDRNKSKSTNEVGKIVVPATSLVVKFGKFEDGLVTRLHGYHKHMHYRDESGPVSSAPVFKNVVKSIKYLSLNVISKNKTDWNQARIYEQYWNTSLHNYLNKNDFLSGYQNIRSEYRVLNQRALNHENQIFDDSFLNKISLNIHMTSSNLFDLDV